jgi:alpha-ribazole phosphatase
MEGDLSKLLLIRHGDTELNSRERYWGQRDVKLSAAGVRQAEKLRDRLATEKITAAYSSDLERAALTAKIIASPHQLEVITCPELRETNFGKIEGLTFEEVSRLYPELTQLWVNWSLQLKFPDGESVDELSYRVSKFLERLKKHAADDTILIVAHAGPLRLLVCRLLELELQHWRQIRIGLASLSIIETYPQGAVVSLLNDICHLGQDG